MTTGSLDWITGATEYTYVEELNKKWSNERDKRLGTLKIYLNGVRVYKLKDWEEVIPTQRGSENNLVQSWGGGTDGYLNIHTGETQFSILDMNYTEQPLDFIQVRNNFLSRLNSYNFQICGINCEDEPIGLNYTNELGLLTEFEEYMLTENNDVILY